MTCSEDYPPSGRIDDGFGDETSAEVAMRFSSWSHAVAGTMVNASSALYDDLVQESLIEVWRTVEKTGVTNAVYLTKSARFRMMQVVSGKPMIGGDSTPGPKSRPTTVGVDWDAIESDPEERSSWMNLLAAADMVDAVDWAYHQGEIAAALDALKPTHRTYVYRKYWLGWKDTEIAKEMGVDRRRVVDWWANTIKPSLRKTLAHMGDAA